MLHWMVVRIKEPRVDKALGIGQIPNKYSSSPYQTNWLSPWKT